MISLILKKEMTICNFTMLMLISESSYQINYGNPFQELEYSYKKQHEHISPKELEQKRL